MGHTPKQSKTQSKNQSKGARAKARGQTQVDHLEKSKRIKLPCACKLIKPLLPMRAEWRHILIKYAIVSVYSM